MKNEKTTQPSLSRRRFLESTLAGTAVTLVAPAIVTAKKSDSSIVLGTGDYRYEVHHDCVSLPDRFSWQTTHNVALDKSGNLYVIHEGHEDKADHPSIFVFDADGKYIRSFGNQFQGGGHGLEVRDEDGQEFLYVTAYQHLKTFAKLDLNGETVWQKFAPMDAGGALLAKSILDDGIARLDRQGQGSSQISRRSTQGQCDVRRHSCLSHALDS